MQAVCVLWLAVPYAASSDKSKMMQSTWYLEADKAPMQTVVDSSGLPRRHHITQIAARTYRTHAARCVAAVHSAQLLSAQTMSEPMQHISVLRQTQHSGFSESVQGLCMAGSSNGLGRSLRHDKSPGYRSDYVLRLASHHKLLVFPIRTKTCTGFQESRMPCAMGR